VALALAVRWMCLELGLTRVAATAVALVQRPGRNRRLAAAALLLVAILWRDSAVTVPAMATLFVLARPDRDRGWRDLSGALRSTASLWIVSLAYVSVRIARGLLTAPSDDGYRSELGIHMLENLSTMLRCTGQFGMYRRSGVLEGVLMAVLVIGFRGALVGGAVLALRRRNLLPAAGLVAVGTVVFVAGMAFAAKVVDDRHWINRYQARAEVLADTARAHPITDGILVVEEACPGDAEETRDGALFRVVLGRPELRVRFRVLEPGSRPTTPWGCPTRPADAAR